MFPAPIVMMQAGFFQGVAVTPLHKPALLLPPEIDPIDFIFLLPWYDFAISERTKSISL